MNTKDKLDVMQAYLDGKEIQRSYYLNQWEEDELPSWNWADYQYRIKPEIPQKQLVIPWEHIKPKYKWAAMDKDGELFVFVCSPKQENTLWWDQLEGGCESINVLNIDTDGVDWKQSLIERPEGV